MSHDNDPRDADPLFVAIHDLVTRILEGTATATDRAGLEELVARSEEARTLYLAYMQETALLKWQLTPPAVEAVDDPGVVPPVPRQAAASIPSAGARVRAWWTTIALAAAAAIGWAVVLVRQPAGSQVAPTAAVAGPTGDQPPVVAVPPVASPAVSPSEAAARIGVATLTCSSDVVWSDPAAKRGDLSRLASGEILRFDRGAVELVFDAGVQVLIRGPADFEVRAADYAVARLGAISARVGEDGRGFTIETPTARVVDLGTEFGIDVAPSGATEVAVFRGLVDLSVGRGDPPRRLRQGEALRVAADGTLARVMAISSDRFPEPSVRPPQAETAPTVISNVRDNSDKSGAEGSRKFYKIVRGGLREDAQAFVDRNHQWNGVTSAGLPEFLRGLDYVMPYNDDKFADDLDVSIDLTQPATLYVLYSDSLPVPDWLARDFIDTGHEIGLDEAKNRFVPTRRTEAGPGASIDTVFSVWRRDIVEPTTVTLGAVPVPVGRDGYNMYGIAAAPLPLADERKDADGSL